MADEESMQKDLKALRTVFIGTSVILWILAVFMIMRLNEIKVTLQETQQTMQTQMSIMSMNSPDRFEIKDTDGNTIYTIDTAPMMDEMGMMEGDEGMMPPPEEPAEEAETE